MGNVGKVGRPVVTVVTVVTVAAECFDVEGIEHTPTLRLVCDRMFYERVSNVCRMMDVE